MKKIIGYLKSSFYNIRRNKLFSIFYIVGTALSFVFIIVILQFVKLISTEVPPAVNADRTISIMYFKDKQGRNIGGIMPHQMEQFAQSANAEKYSYVNNEVLSCVTEGQFFETSALFVGGDYFDMNQFDFVSGHAFTKEDIERKHKVVVIKENLAEEYFPNGDAIGKEIYFQGNSYKVVGIVANYSMFVSNAEAGCMMWIPVSYNKFIPSQNIFYVINLQFPESMDRGDMGKNLVNAVQAFYANKNQEVDFDENDVHTQQEEKIESYFSGYIRYGIWGAFVLLLLVPALNIVVLSNSRSSSREEEMAIKRAIGATKVSIFFQLLSESLVLVIIGLLLGCALCMPTMDLIQQFVMGEEWAKQMSLITELDWMVIGLQVFPLSLLFTLLSGGLPAYWVAKKNIAFTLKGGSKV